MQRCRIRMGENPENLKAARRLWLSPLLHGHPTRPPSLLQGQRGLEVIKMYLGSRGGIPRCHHWGPLVTQGNLPFNSAPCKVVPNNLQTFNMGTPAPLVCALWCTAQRKISPTSMHGHQDPLSPGTIPTHGVSTSTRWRAEGGAISGSCAVAIFCDVD